MTRLRISGSPDQDILASLYGEQSGIFTKLGLDVQVESSSNSAAVAAAVLSGALEIGKSSLFSLVIAHSKGIPFVLEAPASIWNTETPSSAIVVAKGSPIRTGRDLNGKTVSVPALHDLYYTGIAAWVDQTGGDSRTVKFLELPHQAVAAALVAGRIDAAQLAPPMLAAAVQNGQVQIIGRGNDAIAKHFITTAYFCSAGFAAKNADALARFRKGLTQAATYANANRPKMIPLLVAYSGVDAKALADMPPVGAASQLEPRLVEPMIDAAVKYKIIPSSFPAKDMIDPNALQ